MHKLWPLVLPMLLVSAPAASQHPPADFPAQTETGTPQEKMPFLGGFLKETRIVYPLELGPWKAVGEHLYEQQEFGVSVRYAHGNDVDRWIDLYFYPAGVLSDEQFKDAAESERKLILQMQEQPGGYESIDMGGLQRFFIASPEEGEKKHHVMGYAIDMSYVHGGETKNSAMTLLLDRLYFVKGRFSIAEDRMSRRKARQLLKNFVGELAPRLTIVSSGECWMPLPIDKLDGADPRADALSVRSASDKDTEFLVGDRVLARDPESPGAKALMILGMAMQGRLFPGCGSAEPVNPSVPEGMREIRLEFRAPAETDSDPLRRMRSPRSGVG